jgi:hypothetical protein
VTLGLRALIPGAHKNGPPSTNHVKIGMMAGASAGGREVDCHRLVITALVAVTMALEEGNAWMLLQSACSASPFCR